MQIISKSGRVFCTTYTHYPADVIKSMKKAGYSVKEIADGGSGKNGKQKEK